MYTTALQSHTWIGQNKGQQKKKNLLYSQATLYQMNYTRNNCSPLASDLPMSRRSVLETPSLLSTSYETDD